MKSASAQRNVNWQYLRPVDGGPIKVVPSHRNRDKSSSSRANTELPVPSYFDPAPLPVGREEWAREIDDLSVAIDKELVRHAAAEKDGAGK